MYREPRPKIKCPACNGGGLVYLGEELFNTYSIVKELGSAGSMAVWRHKRCTQGLGLTAIINRLQDLHDLGLLKRKKVGLAWVYELA